MPSNASLLVTVCVTFAGEKDSLLEFYEVHHLLMSGLRESESIHTHYLISWLQIQVIQRKGGREGGREGELHSQIFKP